MLGSLGQFGNSLLKEQTFIGLEHDKVLRINLGRRKERDDLPIWKLRSLVPGIRQISRLFKVTTTSFQVYWMRKNFFFVKVIDKCFYNLVIINS